MDDAAATSADLKDQRAFLDLVEFDFDFILLLLPDKEGSARAPSDLIAQTVQIT
jgi:hypothetical protein